MATHNYVRLLGVLRKTPTIIQNNGLTTALMNLIVINKNRTEKDTYYYNVPTIMTDNLELIGSIATYKEFDIIEIEGVMTTKNVAKASICEFCGEKNVKYQASIFVVTPIYMCLRGTGFATKEEALNELRPHAEISNKCFAMGTLVKDPEFIEIGRNKRATTRYPIAVQRKYYINTDASNIYTDYPWINTLNEQGKQDSLYLHKDSLVYVEGYIQTRKAVQTTICSSCKREYNWNDSAVEIIGNSVEYLRNYYSKEEVMEKEEMDYLYFEE